MKEKQISQKIILTVILLVIAILSITVISKYATSTETHAKSIAELDEKKGTTMTMTAGVVATSTAISALPNDAASPIANKLSDLTTPLLIVFCALYLEKFLLTTIGYLSFTWLIPMACGLLAIYIFWRKDILRVLAIKLAIFGVAIYMIVPVSLKVTNLIEETFAETIDQTMNAVTAVSEESEIILEEEGTEDTAGFFDKIMDSVSGVVDNVSNVIDSAKNVMGLFVDATAVLLITTCVIPIAVIIFFAWIIKILFGVNVPVPGKEKEYFKL